jgi:hypothetical protein
MLRYYSSDKACFSHPPVPLFRQTIGEKLELRSSDEYGVKLPDASDGTFFSSGILALASHTHTASSQANGWTRKRPSMIKRLAMLKCYCLPRDTSIMTF